MRLVNALTSLIARPFQGANDCFPEAHPFWQAAELQIASAETVIDLGCGMHPHPKATVAVDAFLAPEQRGLGGGAHIDSAELARRGVRFVQASICELPFADKAFDFAYSRHVLEHVPDPKKACTEICRIAKAGAIICPSIFAEFAFGRSYHLWFVAARGNTLVFMRKRADEDRPFGENPVRKKSGGFRVVPDSNPFDILLNENGWYHGRERMPRLSRLLRHYWFSHSPVMEAVFTWRDSFNCLVIEEDGSVR
jgi:ubiquinone/menaquinone biosynthesis C-methylase UbiE